jgi:AcrR family transcriptional regulator
MSSAECRIFQAAIRLFAKKGATQLPIRELAEAAGVARGTIYNNMGSLDALFEQVAGKLASEMSERLACVRESISDPAERLSHGIRFFIRRAHEEPDWGRFFVRFALSTPSLQATWNGPPMQNVLHGIAEKRYELRPDQANSFIAFLGASVVAGMLLVLDGHRTWRDAGADIAELVLKSLGVPAEDARRLALTDLPPLPALAA